MDLGLVLAVAEALFSALHSQEVKKIFSFCGYKSQLEDLQRTVSTVQSVLRDAENKQELSHEAKFWIEELKDAVYDADDLFDEFCTFANRKLLVKDGKFSEKACLFFSCNSSPCIACKMSHGVKQIRKKLDAIAKNHWQFGFSIDSQCIRWRREETCSDAYKGNVIGREDDVKKIVDILLGLEDDVHPNIQQDVSCLTIVGIGGLGKTTLAKLVYNDARVTCGFPLRLWTCVSDHVQEQLDVKGILQKILASATGQMHEGSTLECLQRQLRGKLRQSKYLLVLDDLWTESRNCWLQLLPFLLGGQTGSWIVITTRSKKTAQIVGNGPMYELQGLSKEDSWRLFKETTFGSRPSTFNADLVDIGQEIIKECASNPLAIRVVGSLLYGQDKSKWLSFTKLGLCNFKEMQSNIMSILKFSYHQLDLPLKNCFAYCALFPKDFEIEKEMLVNLWMAQGFVIPLYNGQTIEDAAEEYISILSCRCFFQNIEHDEYGKIFSFKIHDLMHDVAMQVAGKEICVTNSVTNVLDKKVRHLALMRSKSTQYSFTRSHIRSFLCHSFWFMGAGKMDQISLKALLKNWRCLRVLHLSSLGIKSVPDSIGNLLHLRYLNLSHNEDLDVLPESLVKLHHLQVLNLYWCQGLKELPKGLRKLVNLRVLDARGAGISCMPRGLGMLSSLHTLTMFKVKDLMWNQLIEQFVELKHLKNLKDKLHISITFPECVTKYKEESSKEGEYLETMEHLTPIEITNSKEESSKKEEYLKTMEHLTAIEITLKGRGYNDEASGLMEKLQPHSNLEGLSLFGYNGVKMPTWGKDNNLVTSLPNLIRLELSHIDIDYLEDLGNLLNLKVLSLDSLRTLKWISRCSSECPNVSIYPSLEELNFSELPKLENWSSTLLLPLLKKLSIHICPDLISNLLCPILEEISLENFNKELKISISSKALGDEMMMMTSSNTNTTTISSSSSSCTISKLWRVEIDDVNWLNLLDLEAFQRLEYLSIRSDEEVVRLSEVEEVIKRCSSTLQCLKIEKCSKLESVVSGGLEHLTALKDLCLVECCELQLSTEGGGEGGKNMATTSYSLQTIVLEDLRLLIDLPNWIQYLTNLQTLRVRNCKGLESLPDWMPKLSSLRKLDLWGCSAASSKDATT